MNLSLISVAWIDSIYIYNSTVYFSLFSLLFLILVFLFELKMRLWGQKKTPLIKKKWENNEKSFRFFFICAWYGPFFKFTKLSEKFTLGLQIEGGGKPYQLIAYKQLIPVVWFLADFFSSHTLLLISSVVLTKLSVKVFQRRCSIIKVLLHNNSSSLSAYGEENSLPYHQSILRHPIAFRPIALTRLGFILTFSSFSLASSFRRI